MLSIEGLSRTNFKESKAAFRPCREAEVAVLATLYESTLAVRDRVLWMGEFSREAEAGGFWSSAGHPSHFFFFLGMATLTAPQAHGWPGRQGQLLRGRPGFRTSHKIRSPAWLHLVDR